MDDVFFRGVQAYEQRVQAFSREITNTVELAVIVRKLRQHILGSLVPGQLHIFIYDPLNDQYAAASGWRMGAPPVTSTSMPSSPLVTLLQSSSIPVSFEENTLPPELKPEQTRLVLLGTSLFVPLPGSQRPIGWLALGPRRSGETYGTQDLGFLEKISLLAAVAVERAQVIFDLERRVQR